MMHVPKINLNAEEDCDDLSTAEKQKRGKSIYFLPKTLCILFIIKQETLGSLT
jgi:hypothetical protein